MVRLGAEESTGGRMIAFFIARQLLRIVAITFVLIVAFLLWPLL